MQSDFMQNTTPDTSNMHRCVITAVAEVTQRKEQNKLDKAIKRLTSLCCILAPLLRSSAPTSALPTRTAHPKGVRWFTCLSKADVKSKLLSRLLAHRGGMHTTVTGHHLPTTCIYPAIYRCFTHSQKPHVYGHQTLLVFCTATRKKVNVNQMHLHLVLCMYANQCNVRILCHVIAHARNLT